MKRIPSPYKKLVLICTNVRADGTACCGGPLTGSGATGAEQLRVALKEIIKEKNLPARVSKSGCLGMCGTGPTVVIMPDDLWFGGASPEDADAIVVILEQTAVGGR